MASEALVQASRDAPEPKQARSQATRARLLDAAVDELVEFGYSQLKTERVAARAGLTRGAQQHHFPSKAKLVSEAVRHLADRQAREMSDAITRVAVNEGRLERILDVLFGVYSGQLFKTVLELTFAARGDDILTELMPSVEQSLSDGLNELGSNIFSDLVADLPDFSSRVRLVMATVRGTALLILLGHPTEIVERQWEYTRTALTTFLTDSRKSGLRTD